MKGRHTIFSNVSVAGFIGMACLTLQVARAQVPNLPGKPSAVERSSPLGRSQLQDAPQNDVERLRLEVESLRREVQTLRMLIKDDATDSRPRDSSMATPATSSPSLDNDGRISGGTGANISQPPAMGTQKGVIRTKAQGGDLSGAGNLLRTDRITIGGYGDFQFRDSAINERADGGGTPTFQNTRLVLAIGAVLAEKQNIIFNSEIEYEFGSREIDVEQAFVEWKVRPEFSFRGGIIVPSIGRFNTLHDSYLNLTTIRPLINQFIIPTAYRDAGIGIRGRFKLRRKMRLSYEADLVNGMQATNANGEATPFSRLLGQASAAEPGQIAFQAGNRRKAFVGRAGFSPLTGIEFGISAYNGRFNKLGDPTQSVTIVFFDGSYRRGPLTINGEYGRSHISGQGIRHQSPSPPIVDPANADSIRSLAQFVAEKSPGQDGFYLEGAYSIPIHTLGAANLDQGAYISPVVRYEIVRMDRTIASFYLNRSRTTLGLNLAPSSSVIFKLNYIFNHPFGPVPNVPAGVGGALFGTSPLPYLGYGRNGFAGSLAYIF